jgi:hypothetical protein
MNRKQYLEIEIKSFQEVLSQFSKGDNRMSTLLDKFCNEIEDRIQQLKAELDSI